MRIIAAMVETIVGMIAVMIVVIVGVDENIKPEKDPKPQIPSPRKTGIHGPLLWAAWQATSL